MHTEWAGRNVVCYKVTDSTNLRIKQMGDEGALAGTLAVAEEQTAGRGAEDVRGNHLPERGSLCRFF